MDSSKITIVNRHYPPNLNVTGENVWDMASYMIEHHHIDVHIVHVDRAYTGGGHPRKPVGTIHKVKTIYTGNIRFLRYLAGLWDGYWLIRIARKLNCGPIIVLTSPPMLPMWASMMLRKKEWILWSMDLFPEGFGAINEIKAAGFFYNLFYRKTYQHAPDRIIALGPNQKKLLERKYKKDLEGVILPCGVFVNKKEATLHPEWKREPDKIYFGYLGNCGIPHSPAFVKAAMDAIDPDRHVMILVAYGVYAEDLKAYARDKPGIQVMENIPRNELNHIDVHLVTLLPSWTHIAVPSKAVSSVTSGSAMIFCGNRESDNWELLQDAAWHVDDDTNLRNNLGKLMNTIDRKQIEFKRSKARELGIRLTALVKDSYDTVSSWAK